MTKRKTRWNLFIVILILAIFMPTVMVCLSRYVRQSIHNERTVYLSAQTESVSGLIDSIITQYMDYAEVCANIISEELQEGDNIKLFMDAIQSKLYRKDTRLILVDEDCTWYGENSSYGRITVPELYARNTEGSVLYLTTGVDVTVEGMVFRVRLSEPVEVVTDSGHATISYCAVICYMDVMSKRFEGAFPYQCNSFICDDNGLMLYRNLKLGLLIDGSNVLSKMERGSFLYNDTGSELAKKVKRQQTVVGELEISDQNYFFCSSALSVNRWFVAFIFRSDDLAAGQYIRTILLYIAILGLVFSLAVAVAVTSLVQFRENEVILERQREANALLERASRSKSEFLSNMSHDIRTPINGIMGMTALAQAQNNDPKTADCLRKIAVSSSYLLSLVNDVLDMSSIESGKVVITEKPCDLRIFLDNCVSILNGQLQDRQVEFVSDFDGLCVPYVLCDELHLRQILINILSNAVKFTPDGGSIRFSVRNINDSTEFTIADTGVGMDEAFLATIWDRFSQEHNGSRSLYKGSGLGMAITKQLVDLMGGSISVTSKLNEGSTFVVLLPLRETEPVLSPVKAEKGTVSIEGCRILLAEDNDINMEIALELLEDRGAVLTPAENGKIALELFSSAPPGSFDVILMDIMMPEMNGLEATRAIRALPREDAAAIPIIAMTANAFDDDIRATREAGLDAHLSKPMDVDQVVKMISNLWKRRKET